MDPTGHDALLRWLAYAHPTFMLLSIGVAAVTLRLGLGLRRARRARRPRRAAELRRHARFGKVAVTMIALGFVGGPVSMAWLRGRTPYGTAHAWVATLAVVLFLTVAVLGRRLERGRGRPVEAHATLAVIATLAAALAFATGFVLLP